MGFTQQWKWFIPVDFMNRKYWFLITIYLIFINADKNS